MLVVKVLAFSGSIFTSVNTAESALFNTGLIEVIRSIRCFTNSHWLLLQLLYQMKVLYE